MTNYNDEKFVKFSVETKVIAGMLNFVPKPKDKELRQYLNCLYFEFGYSSFRIVGCNGNSIGLFNCYSEDRGSRVAEGWISNCQIPFEVIEDILKNSKKTFNVSINFAEFLENDIQKVKLDVYIGYSTKTYIFDKMDRYPDYRRLLFVNNELEGVPVSVNPELMQKSIDAIKVLTKSKSNIKASSISVQKHFDSKMLISIAGRGDFLSMIMGMGMVKSKDIGESNEAKLENFKNALI